MGIFIQRMDTGTKQRETVSECSSYKEAIYERDEYRLSDPIGKFYISQRACKEWYEENRSK